MSYLHKLAIAATALLLTCGRPGWVKCKQLHNIDTMQLITEQILHERLEVYRQAKRDARMSGNWQRVHQYRVTYDDVVQAMRIARDEATRSECWVPDWR